ncbi:MAG: hypothetical protein Q4G14_09570 [Paracoccus sp. (in: a-proteobacteria)]|uniref:hypothetical protein n=1 Tax=Paracoccus sp. TaxID=267 RepID=UPI0026E0FCD2|nr:hypothetical protein [Paracoccus sp. (in: a-proteobacteria)]MDO5613473.1 hypothetical protein [Paracoccus sp. (in: a-proteobacteria)]
MAARPLGRGIVALALMAGLAAGAAVLALAWRFPVRAAALHDRVSAAVGLDSSRLTHQLLELAGQFALLAMAGALAYGTVIALAAGRWPRLWRLAAAGGMMAALPLLAMGVAFLTPLPVSGAPFVAAVGYFTTGLMLRDWIVRQDVR